MPLSANSKEFKLVRKLIFVAARLKLIDSKKWEWYEVYRKSVSTYSMVLIPKQK